MSLPCPDGSDGPPRNDKPLDIVFLQDTTGSQGSYIQAARKAIRNICDKISTAGQLDKALIRFGLIAFRDHPPQDRTYVTKNFGFTNDINVMQKNLFDLTASGGGDGPEAQTAALAAALNMKWAEKAVKLVILITDAPPHGLGELGDGFSAGSPDQNDPLMIARQMAERGITLFVIACEPTLSTQYKNAVDFYQALTEITSGQIFPLLLAEQLGDYIVGTALETMETEKLIEEFEQVILDDVYNKDVPVEKVAENLQQFMETKGRTINSVVMEEVYTKNERSSKNQAAWSRAASIGEARKKVEVVAEPRILPQFMSRSAYVSPALVALPEETGSTRGRGRLVPPSSAMAYRAPPSPRADMAPLKAHKPTSFDPAMIPAPPTMAAAGATGWSNRATPMAPPPPPSFSVKSQHVSQKQAQRVVMSSVARSSAVTSRGMFSKASGQAASRSETSASQI